ncbi:MAG: ABC transporter ATP-binding protein [Anaerolineales bacterium]|nr:ABC transporter ATP-binding protein [Anaerolineales bacterium]
MTTAVQTRDLSKSFGVLNAVNRLTVSIERGEVFGFLGPNGAGKTTTIRMLTALIAPSAGTAQVAGFTLGEDDQQIRSRVGILTESPGLYDNLSTERNLAFFGHLYRVPDLSAQVDRYLKLLGLWGRRQDPAATLSRGMRQKLAIARALLHEPEILFLDEPTSGLDPEAARLVREFVADLKQAGRTIFLCTHNLEEADRLCDRVAVFNTRLVAMDTPAALRYQLFGRKVVFHLRAVRPGFEDLVSGYGFVQQVQSVENKLVVTLENPEENNPLLVQALVAAGADIQFLGEIKRSLEDIYLQLLETARLPEVEVNRRISEPAAREENHG